MWYFIFVKYYSYKIDEFWFWQIYRTWKSVLSDGRCGSIGYGIKVLPVQADVSAGGDNEAVVNHVVEEAIK